jgi:L-aspartate oxidase
MGFSNVYDHIIVGTGIAGLYTALLAQEHGRVLLITKAGLDDGNTSHAQGGIAAAIGADDTPSLHWYDTLVAGAGLSDPLMAWILASEGPARVAELARFGVPFDREGGLPALAREGAHSRHRVLHAGGDATGARIQLTLHQLVQQASNITVREHALVTDLIVAGDAVRGVEAFDCRTAQRMRYAGKVVVLATGGAGQLYQHTTNPVVATGTGVALAYRAGASVADLEFCQFHPTALALPNAPQFLISEAVRGEGAILRNADGHRFMFDYDDRGELAPRHVVADAILAEMARLGSPCAYLDLTHLPAQTVLRRFPTIAASCRQYGLDITKSPIPVAPAAHYIMGGVRTNLWGETDVRGLFACGEVACTGVHGANRLASNSLLEALVFGARIVKRTSATCEATMDDLEQWPSLQCVPSLPGAAGKDRVPPTSRVLEDHRYGPGIATAGLSEQGVLEVPPRAQITELQALLWTYAGTARTAASLRTAQRQLERWAERGLLPDTSAEFEWRDMLLVARLLVDAALAREETRGAHRRLDFPSEDSSWRRRLVFRARQSIPSLTQSVSTKREMLASAPVSNV